MADYMHLRIRTHQGFSLIELMIALTIGLVITAAIGGIFVSSQRSYLQDEATTRMQDELRYGLAQIVRDAEMAGFWSEVFDPDAIDLHSQLTIATDCGAGASVPWAYVSLDEPVSVGDNLAAAAVTGKFNCITASGFKANTDVLGMRRLAGKKTDVASLVSGHAYFQSNGSRGLLFKQPISSGALTGILSYYEYQPSVYYIRNYTVKSGDGIPALCREYLSINGGAPSMESECIASGIENLQIELGIDTDDDGAPNAFVSAPTAAQLKQACALRIFLLGRSENADSGYTNAKSYTLGNAALYTPNDRYYRRVVSAVVNMRNPASLRQLK